MEETFAQNCPIIERTSDGIPVGRCWHYLPDGKTCQRHGDVSEAVSRYRESGKLTAEQAAPPHGS